MAKEPAGNSSNNNTHNKTLITLCSTITATPTGTRTLGFQAALIKLTRNIRAELFGCTEAADFNINGIPKAQGLSVPWIRRIGQEKSTEVTEKAPALSKDGERLGVNDGTWNTAPTVDSTAHRLKTSILLKRRLPHLYSADPVYEATSLKRLESQASPPVNDGLLETSELRTTADGYCDDSRTRLLK
jgi:hypothetical protein